MSEPLLEILDRGGKAEDRHDFGGNNDVESILARETVSNPAQANGDLPQRTVVHIDHALPGNPPHIEAELIAMVDMIVDHRGQQIMGKTDRAEVAGEMEIDVLHRHDLRIAAARGAALHAENRPERGLAQTNGRFLADPVQRVAETHRGGRLAFSRRCRADRRHQDQFAIRPVGETVDIVQRYFRLVPAIGLKVLVADAEFFPRHIADLAHMGLLSDFDVRRHSPSS